MDSHRYKDILCLSSDYYFICLNVLLVQEINQFMPNLFPIPHQLDESISNFRIACWVVFYFFIQISKDTSVSKHWRT